MSRMTSYGAGPGAESARAGLRRNAMRWAAGGAAVTAGVAAALAGASAAVAAPAVTTPVPCSVTLLAAAVAAAPSNATLVLARNCVYRLTAGLPIITKNLTIDGNNATLTPSSSSGHFTILTNNGASVTLRQLTITRANNNLSGAMAGAIFNENNGRLSLTDVTLTDNRGPGGGAIFNGGRSLTVSDSTFDGNQATGTNGGGAIYNASGATTTVSGSTFRDNEASANSADGGAISSVGGTVTVETPASSFTDNRTTGNFSTGGAISVAAGRLSVTGASFAGNQADNDGGGVAVASGVTATIGNSTFSGNFTGDNGGAISTGTSLRLSTVTLTSNRAQDNGGGLYADGGLTTLDNSLVLGNRAVNGTGGGIDRAAGTVFLSTNTLVSLNNPNNCSGFSC